MRIYDYAVVFETGDRVEVKLFINKEYASNLYYSLKDSGRECIIYALNIIDY